MGFWSWSSGPHLGHALWPSPGPRPLSLPSTPLRPPYDWKPRSLEPNDVDSLLDFLRAHFDHGASIDISPNDLAVFDNILIVRGVSGRILGCIASRPLGCWRGAVFPTIYIDLYCVHKEYRSAGIGRALLFGIYGSAGAHAVFVKEGTPLHFGLPPIRASAYRWRRVPVDEVATDVRRLTVREFAALGLDILHNIPPASVGAVFSWRGEAFAAFAPANQRIQGESLLWMTGYHEIGSVDRTDAMRNLTAAAARHFDMPLVWVDAEFAPTWNQDGAYYIYAFNWDPGSYWRGRPFLIL